MTPMTPLDAIIAELASAAGTMTREEYDELCESLQEWLDTYGWYDLRSDAEESP